MAWGVVLVVGVGGRVWCVRVPVSDTILFGEPCSRSVFGRIVFVPV